MFEYGGGGRATEHWKTSKLKVEGIIETHICRKKVLGTTINENSHQQSESLRLTSPFISFSPRRILLLLNHYHKVHKQLFKIMSLPLILYHYLGECLYTEEGVQIKREEKGTIICPL